MLRRRLSLTTALLAACARAPAPAHDADAVDDAVDAADAAPLDAVSDALDAATDAATDAASLPDVPLATTCAITPPALATGHLTVAGARLRDALGRTVLLRGANAGGRSKFAPYTPFEFTDDASFAANLARLMDTLAGWGANVVRLPLLWAAAEPTQGTLDEAYLARYGAMLDAAWARGIRVLVDFHQDVYAEELCGDGFPAWTLGTIPHGAPHHDCPDWFQQYSASDGPVQQAFDRLYANQDGLQDAMEATWHELARRFGGHPAVLGFEVLNEPSPGTMDPAAFEQTTLPAFAARMGRAILAVAPDAVIAQGGTGSDAVGSSIALADPGLPAFVYAPHAYDPFVLLGGNYSDAVASRARLDAVLASGDARGRAVFLGEFGASYDSAGAGAFLRDVYDALDRHAAHGTVWEVSLSADAWNGEHLDLLQADGTERTFVDEVVRGYPRAVDGAIDRARWDAAAHTLLLEVSQGGAQPAEVFLPVRHVGQAPRIGLSSGCVSWDAATGRLWVAPAAAQWTLTVQP